MIAVSNPRPPQKLLICCGIGVIAVVLAGVAALVLQWDVLSPPWRTFAIVIASTAFVAGLALVIPAPEDVLVFRALRRLAILFVGCVIILAGIVMLIAPGPGWVAIFAGLGILATEFAFARWILRKTRASLLRVARMVGLQQRLRRWGIRMSFTRRHARAESARGRRAGFGADGKVRG